MKLKIWEMSLIVAIVITLLSGFVLDNSQNELSGKLIRLHVLANSDSDEDQALKLTVRDSILSEISDILIGAESKSEAVTIIEENIPALTKIAADKIEEEGYDYSVSMSIENEDFPTRIYDTFSLPAGNYTSLRVEIGESEGQNWWCVVFPPLCVTAAEGEDSLETTELTDEEVSLITEEYTGYVIKFKALEILDSIKAAVS